jgi:2-keto-4-pentenoate hydratase/2-oxohepta-3-ene-1,7-dioic acid hydratase in catechol pathway
LENRRIDCSNIPVLYLKIGDIIFTGTPAGIGSVSENDLLEGFLMGEKVFSVKIK